MPLLLGGVAFTDEAPSVPVFGMSGDAEAFKSWIAGLTIGGGGDPLENPLDALITATKMAPGGFVALATDNLFHYAGDGMHVTTLTEVEVIGQLQAAGCKVYVDPTSEFADKYQGLAVNGNVEIDLGSFTFPLLRTTVLQGAQ